MPFNPNAEYASCVDLDGDVLVSQGGLWYDKGGNVFSVLPRSNAGYSPPIALSSAQVAAGTQKLLIASVLRPLTAVGTYLGTGAQLTLTLPWVPDLFIVKDVVAATLTIFTQLVGAWVGRSTGYTSAASISNGPVINNDGTVTIGTDANVNTNTNNYEWFAYKDNGSGAIVFGNHSGNDQPTRVIRYTKGINLKAAIFKRDNVNPAHIAIIGKVSKLADGSAATSSVINSDGTVTVGQGADINIWAGTAGEGCNLIGIVDGAQGAYVTTYIGTGAAKILMTPFSDPEAVLIFPRGASGKSGAFWTSRLAAGTTLSISAETAATVGAQAITSVATGRVTLGTDTRCNSNGVEYVMIAFRKSRLGAIFESAPNNRPLRSTKHVMLSPAAYINCGIDDSLKISLAVTMEYWGAHFNSSAVAYPISATNNDNTAIQQPLIWRSNGADGVSGSVSYGLQIQPAQSAGTAMVLGVGDTDIFDMPQNPGAYDLDNNQPWCTGVPLYPRTLFHVLVTHDSIGFWRVYVSGVLVKERDRNMLQAPTPRPNVAGGSGHSLLINGRKRGGAPEMTAFNAAFFGARIYSRELTQAEALNNYNSLFSDNTAVAISDYVEQWLPDNVSGTTLAATKKTVNNGTIVGTFVVEG